MNADEVVENMTVVSANCNEVIKVWWRTATESKSKVK